MGTKETDISGVCPFCELLKQVIDINEYHRQRRPTPDYKDAYTVALVHETYYKGEFSGSTKYCGYELHFCPTCGQSINQGENENAK